MQNQISDFPKEMQEYVAGLLEQIYGHERQSSNLSTAATTIAALEGEEYHGPLVI